MKFPLLRTALAVASLALALPGAALAADSAAQLLQQGGNTQALAEEGRKASFFCANCHGETGNSKHGQVPNLAGQHPAYVLKQIEAFLSGKRKDEFMQGLMKVLSERDKAAIALYYAGSAVKPALASAPAAAAEGAELYGKHCARCHQADARGAETFPRLAGQQPEYLRVSLKRYLTQSGERFYAPMTAAVIQLGEKNIDAVVAYLASRE
ncbi:c-type cytochrome [Azoarcus olearius]|nr:c-type cytochrome [Azoarcus olearius]